MKKKTVLLFVLLLVWQEIGLAKTVTVTDQAGRKVIVKHPVNRVITTFIPATIFALCSDLADVIVGASNKDGTSSIYEALIDQGKPPTLVGNRTAGLSLETISSLKPDLVIMYGQKDGIRLAGRLTSLGIPAIVIMPESMADMADTLDLIGTASGKKAHTDKVINAMKGIQTLIEVNLSGTDRHKVYYAASTLFSTISGDMLQNGMIRLAGGTNVSKNARGFFLTINREQLLSWNPSVIILSDRLSIETAMNLYFPEFSSIEAVKKKNIFRIPAETYWDFPSPLAMAGVLWMAGKIHPEVFSHEMIRAETDNLYDTLFGMGFSRKHPKVVGKSKDS